MEGKTYKPTLNLRWARVKTWQEGLYFLGSVKSAESHVMFLQQAWQCVETGEIEWRNTEVVGRTRHDMHE